jgi:hypothetical protein
MRFPLRLTWCLALGAVARSSGTYRGPIFHLDLSGDSGEAGSATLSDFPVVWISGSDALDHAEVARLANDLAQARRYVFLQTNAVSLRRRIHELRPSPRMYLAIRFEGTQTFHDSHTGRPGAFRHAIEAIRSAQLAGFLVCAHLVIHPATDQTELAPLYQTLSKLDLDGFLISPASPVPPLVAMAARERRDLLPRRWSRLSQLLDSVLLPAAAPASLAAARAARTTSESVSTNCEEGAQA